MARLLRCAVYAGSLSEGKPLPEQLAALIGRRYERSVAEGIAMHEARPPPPSKGSRGRRKRRRGHNLALRPLKVRQKISGSFRSETGTRNHAALRTVLDTARKQGWNLLETLRAPPDKLVARLATREPVQAN